VVLVLACIIELSGQKKLEIKTLGASCLDNIASKVGNQVLVSFASLGNHGKKSVG